MTNRRSGDDHIEEHRDGIKTGEPIGSIPPRRWEVLGNEHEAMEKRRRMVR